MTPRSPRSTKAPAKCSAWSLQAAWALDNREVNGDENNNEDVGDNYTGDRWYYVAQTYYYGDNAEWGAFMDKAYALLNNFETNNDVLNGAEAVAGQRGMLAFLDTTRSLKVYTLSNMMEKVVTGEYEIAMDSIANQVGALDVGLNGYIARYAELESAMVTKAKEAVDVFINNGCPINDLEEIGVCQLSEEAMDEYSAIVNEANDFQSEIDYIIDNSVLYYVETVYGVYNYYGGGSGA